MIWWVVMRETPSEVVSTVRSRVAVSQRAARADNRFSSRAATMTKP